MASLKEISCYFFETIFVSIERYEDISLLILRRSPIAKIITYADLRVSFSHHLYGRIKAGPDGSRVVSSGGGYKAKVPVNLQCRVLQCADWPAASKMHRLVFLTVLARVTFTEMHMQESVVAKWKLCP